jgi:hypothetical protein
MGKSSWYRLALIGAIVIVLLNTWLAARALNTLLLAQYWEAHTLQVISQTETLVAQVRTAESAARGYILTGHDGFQKQYAVATHQIHESTTNLQRLTGDNTSQQVRITMLSTRIGAKLAALDAGLAVRRVQPQGALDPALLGPVIQGTVDDPRYRSGRRGPACIAHRRCYFGAALGVGQFYTGVSSRLSVAGRCFRAAGSCRSSAREDYCEFRCN